MKVTPVFLALSVFGVGLACGASGSTEAKGRGDDAPVVAAAVPAVAPVPDDRLVGTIPSLAPLVKTLSPAVVNLEVVKQTHLPENNPLRQFFGDPGPQQGMGSGFIISPDGYVLTNNHVISDATDVVVRFADQSTAKGKVIGSDERTDVALVKIQEDKTFPFVKLGSSTNLEVGDWVIAIGNPFGLNDTVTSGIVSAKGRQIGDGVYEDFIQTDASINPGNSGGPLFNLKGEVVGINTAINAYGQGIAYAVPVDLVKDRIDELKTSGSIARGWLGVSLQSADKPLLTSLHIPPETTGALVNEVTLGTPAQKAGLQEGDFIVDLDGKHVKSSDDLRLQIGSHRPGDTIDMSLIRNGDKKDLKVKLGERPNEADLANMRGGMGGGSQKGEGDEPAETDKGIFKKIGIEVADASALRNQMGMQVPDDVQGVVVTQVEPASPAAGRLVPEDVITAVNGKAVQSTVELRGALQKGPDPALLVVKRHGGRVLVAVPLHREE